MRPQEIEGGYQHFRTKGEYVIQRSTDWYYDSKTIKPFVRYIQVESQMVFGRSFDRFFETVEEEGYQGPRFKKLFLKPLADTGAMYPVHGLKGIYELPGLPDQFIVDDDCSWVYNEADMRPHVIYTNARMNWKFGMDLEEFRDVAKRLSSEDLKRFIYLYGHPLRETAEQWLKDQLRKTGSC